MSLTEVSILIEPMVDDKIERTGIGCEQAPQAQPLEYAIPTSHGNSRNGHTERNVLNCSPYRQRHGSQGGYASA